jgi:hypothetical protein
MAKVKVKVREISVIDDNSVGIFLDFDNISNPGKTVETLNAIKDWTTGSISFWDVIKIIITVWKG